MNLVHVFLRILCDKLGKVPVSDVRILNLERKLRFLYGVKFYKGLFFGYPKIRKNFSSLMQITSIFDSRKILDLMRKENKHYHTSCNVLNNFEDTMANQWEMKGTKCLSGCIANDGNWTIDNSKTQLHQFLQKNNIAADYKYSITGPDHSKTFVAEMTIFINKLNLTIKGSGSASTKVCASKCCAFSLVQQLYSLGLIKAFEAKKKIKFSERSYSVAISPQLEQEIYEILNFLDTEPAKTPYEGKDGNTQVTLLSNSSVPEETPTNTKPLDFSWSPPTKDWNAWRGCTISKSENDLDKISEDFKKSFCQKLKESEHLKKVLLEQQQLPIVAKKEEILKAVNDNSVIIISGSTGCGKTTQVCQFILNHHIQKGKGGYCNIVVTQPRRISAISAAKRVAFERGELLGISVGYCVRFTSCFPRPFGSILFSTVGTFLKKLQTGLRGISHIIVDEIHERDLNTDFLLIIIRDLIRTNSDLKVILMSATVNTALFSKYFANCPVLSVSGRTFEVKKYFLEDCIQMTNFMPPVEINTIKHKNVHKGIESDDEMADEEEAEENLNKVISDEYLPETKVAMSRLSEKSISFELIEDLLKHFKKLGIPGAVLVFLPGWKDIISLMRFLQEKPHFNSSNYVFLPLHSMLSEENQQKVFDVYPGHITKVILATNVAETSITVEDVVCVIDSCKLKMNIYSSSENAFYYSTIWASKENLRQRRGRAGRTRPGMCFHLCSKARYQKLEERIVPEMMRVALYTLVLNVKLLGLGSATEFLAKALQPPPLEAVVEAKTLLRKLKCLDSKNELTPLGKVIGILPVRPQLGKMLVFGCLFNCGDALAVIAAKCSMSSEVFILTPGNDLTSGRKAFACGRFSDHLAVHNAFQTWEQASFSGRDAQKQLCDSKMLSVDSLKDIRNARNQLLELLTNTGFLKEFVAPQVYNYNAPDPRLDVSVGLLTMGFSPNFAYHLSNKKLLTNGKKFAVMNKMSVNCINNNQTLPIPFLVYEEKIISKIATCRELTMITPIHLLLFGDQKVKYINNQVILDNWIKLNMEPKVASAIIAFRGAIDYLLNKVVSNPEGIIEKSQICEKIINVTTKLCEINAGRYKMDPIKFT